MMMLPVTGYRKNMRIRNVSLILRIGLLFLGALTFPACADSKIQVVPESVNFGLVEQGDKATVVFQLHNTGTEMISIQWMEFSNPGLVAWTKAQIAAESSVDVVVNWSTDNLMGHIEGQVTLGLDSPENPEVVFTITGAVVPSSASVSAPEEK